MADHAAPLFDAAMLVRGLARVFLARVLCVFNACSAAANTARANASGAYTGCYRPSDGSRPYVHDDGEGATERAQHDRCSRGGAAAAVPLRA